MVTSPLFDLPDPNMQPIFSILRPTLFLISRFVIGFDGGDESKVRSLVKWTAYIELFIIHVLSFPDRRVVPVAYVTYCSNTPNYIWILTKNPNYTSRQVLPTSRHVLSTSRHVLSTSRHVLSTSRHVLSAYFTTNSRLVLCNEKIVICCGNLTAHIIFGQNSEFLDVIADVIHTYHSTLVKYYPFHS
jgi:hypothetical protein